MIPADIVWLRDEPGLPATALIARLPADEQAMLAGFVHPERQRSFLLSRILLRQLLAPRLPGNPLRFTRAGNGRLVLADAGAWQFSLSHADGCIAVIISPAPCGIDIEKPRTAAFEKIAARYFSPNENAALAKTTGTAKAALFFRLWTLKEASVKALGEGLANNMSRLAFDVSGTSPRLLAESPALQLWQEKIDALYLSAAVQSEASVNWNIQEIKPGNL